MKKLIYLIIILFIFGCAAEEEEESSPPAINVDIPVETEFIGGNNAASLEGDLIGTGESSNDELARSVQIALKTPSQYFSIVSAIIARENTDSISVQLILTVKNKTENLAFCDVTTTGITLNDGLDNWIISTISNNKILGDFGIGESKSPASCIKHGKTGLMLQSITAIDENMLDLYDEIAQVEIDKIIYLTSSVIDPNIKIIPQSYTVNDGVVSVNVKNIDEDYGYVFPGQTFMVLYDKDGVITETMTDATTDTDEYVIVDQTTDANTDITTYTIEKPGTPGLPLFYFPMGGPLSVPYELRPGEDATMDSSIIEFSGSSFKAKIILGLGTDPWSPAFLEK